MRAALYSILKALSIGVFPRLQSERRIGARMNGEVVAESWFNGKTEIGERAICG